MPRGGGGTDFDIVFSYIDEYLCDVELAAIIIMTDGYAPFPDRRAAKGIPVLWIVNNRLRTPPWGKVIRL